jgi:hypothetical protein
MKLATNIQKASLPNGLNCKPRRFETSKRGKARRITIAPNIKITPNNFWGIDLNIA